MPIRTLLILLEMQNPTQRQSASLFFFPFLVEHSWIYSAFRFTFMNGFCNSVNFSVLGFLRYRSLFSFCFFFLFLSSFLFLLPFWFVWLLRKPRKKKENSVSKTLSLCFGFEFYFWKNCQLVPRKQEAHFGCYWWGFCFFSPNGFWVWIWFSEMTHFTKKEKNPFWIVLYRVFVSFHSRS